MMVTYWMMMMVTNDNVMTTIKRRTRPKVASHRLNSACSNISAHLAHPLNDHENKDRKEQIADDDDDKDIGKDDEE